MRVGLGLDFTLGLDFDDQAVLAREAAELGYAEIWTPEGAGIDSFQLCAMRWRASAEVTPGGLATGIAVSPVAYRTPMAFAMSAGTLGAHTGGRFVLGIGSGGLYRPEFRRAMGFRTGSTLEIMRDYLATTRALLAGETVEREGMALSVHGQRLAIEPPPRTAVYLGALGPRMLELGGEIADGICLNWCSTEQVAAARRIVDAGAAKAGRRAGSVPLVEYIRVSVDEDVGAARRALGRATLGYALGPRTAARDRRFGYRPHFERMGFADELAALDDRRSGGASDDEVADAASDELLLSVGYFGAPAGAREHVERLAQGLDVALVRVVASRPGLDAVRSVMEACAPGGG